MSSLSAIIRMLLTAVTLLAVLATRPGLAQQDLRQAFERELSALFEGPQQRTPAFADVAQGAPLRRLLDPARAADVVNAYAAARRSGLQVSFEPLAQMLLRYRQAFDMEPRAYEEEYLATLAWELELMRHGAALGGWRLGAADAMQAEAAVREKVERGVLTEAGARRATELANRLQAAAVLAFPQQLRTRPLASGREVYAAVCAACHLNGIAAAPPLGNRAAWAPRLAGRSFETLVASTLHGKGAMPPQRGGDFTDPELARSVAFMVSAAGANHPEPALPSGHSGWITVPIRQAMAPALATPPAPPYAEMDAQQRRRFGESVYAANCAACHQPSGRGAGTLIPDLANAASLRDPAQAIAIVLQGRGAMPAWRGVLGDEQVAEVLNFMATQFVTAPSTKVTPADVRARREAPR